jgi:pyruvate dehydrogenase complex dehydrogenase (E1) component
MPIMICNRASRCEERPNGLEQQARLNELASRGADGVCDFVSEILAEHCPAPLKRIGLRDTFGMSGKPDDLLKHYGLTANDIKQAALKVIARKAGHPASPVMDHQAPSLARR